MPKPPPSSYRRAPEMPDDPEIRERFTTIVKVLAGEETVAGAARALGLSRNHFQTLMHRTIAAMLAELTPKPGGRPAKPEREVALEDENRQLRRQLEQLEEHTTIIERMMGVVGEIASGRMRLPRSRRRATPTKESAEPTDPEPERAPSPPTTTTQASGETDHASTTASPSQMSPRPKVTLSEAVMKMHELDVPTTMCARVLRVSPATVRRRAKAREPRARRARARTPSAEACNRIRSIVRATRGAVGVDGLRRRSGGALSRRQCTQIKRAELRELEHERKETCAHVSFAAPGIVRGFDAMHIRAGAQKAYWLVAADAAIPYRTTIWTCAVYDAEQVIAALVADFERHGRPLVVRLDRIACQRTPEVYAMLAHYEVLPLHGPPRYPRYYGQLERQNRQHRAWLRYTRASCLAELDAEAAQMRTALNELWPRPRLDGWTADQAWQARHAVDVERQSLRRDVERAVAGLVRNGVELLRAQRIAIETALQDRGLLRINYGASAS